MNLELIKKRRSVRTFDDKGLSEEDINNINKIISDLDNPFDVEINIVLLDSKKYNLDSPVIVGEKYYLCAIVNKNQDYLLGLGYVFEDLVMKLEEINLATTIIAGTYKKDNFLKTLNLKDDQHLALISPVGHKAEKMAVRETLMRKGINADSRYDFSKLFFLNDFNKPIDSHNELFEALEAIRWAPSAVNKQPWRVLVNDLGVHFFKKEDKGYEEMQTIDMGIALRNFAFINKKTGKIV